MSILESIPKELIYQITQKLDLNQLQQLCSTNSNFRQICQNEELWRQLVERDFPNKKKFGTWFFTYQYYNRKVYLLNIVRNGETVHNLIFSDVKDAINYIKNKHIFLMNPNQYPNLNIPDLFLKIEKDLGGYTSIHFPEILTNQEAVKLNFRAIFETSIRELNNRTDDDIYQILTEYFDIRNEYLNKLIEELIKTGTIDYDESIEVVTLTRQPIL